MQLPLLGWLIIVFGVSLSSVGGLVLGRYATAVDTFLVGGRKVRKFLLTSSGQATEVGIIAIMMMAQEGYVNGPVALAFTAVTLVVNLLPGVTGFIVYRLRQSEAITLGDYAEKRFSSKQFRMFTTVPLLVAGIGSIAMFPPVLGVFFTFFLGLPTHTDLLGFAVSTPLLISTVFLAVIVAYTLVAASTGLVFADFLQYFLIWVALVGIAVFALRDTSWNAVARVFESRQGAHAFNLVKSSSYGMGWIGFMMLQCMFGAIVWPPAVSRILSTKAPVVSKQFYVLSSLMQPGRIAILTFAGLAAAVSIPPEHLPTHNQVLLNAPTLAAMPMYVSKIMSPMWLSLFILGVLAAEISTLDTYLLAWSGVTTHDLVIPLMKRNLSERSKVQLNKLIVVVLGVLVYLWGVFFALNETLLTYVMLAAATYTAGAAAFVTCGLYWKRANATGAWCAMITGMVLPVMSMAATGFMGRPFLAMKWVGILAYVMAFIGMIAGSLIGERYGKLYRAPATAPAGEAAAAYVGKEE